MGQVRGWLIGLVAGLVVLTGCSGDPTRSIETPNPNAAEREACRAMFDAELPNDVAGQSGLANREALILVYGSNDPIVVRCGVPTPEAMSSTARCDVVNDIGWFSEKTRKGYRFTTIGRAANVEVVVPKRYAPEADVLVELSGLVSRVANVKPCV